MKKINLPILAILILSVVSCAEREVKDNASIEPNDTVEQANTISLGTEFSMAVYPEGDVDWYEVEVIEQGYLEVFTRDVPEELDIRIRFATYDEWGAEKENYLTGKMETPAAIPVHEADKYYVEVSDRRGNNYSEEEFDIKIDFTGEFDAFEPNNNVSSAAGIDLGEEYQSAIFPTGDEDWFRVEVEERGYLNIGAKSVPEDIDLAAFIATYDEYSADNKINRLTSTKRVPFNVAVTEPGEYYVVLRDRLGRNQSKDLFTWRVEFIPEMDEYEPNDSFTEAAEIELGETVEIAIFPEGDRDFFKFYIQEKGTVSVRTGDVGNIDLTAELLKLDPEDSSKTVSVKDQARVPVSFNIEDGGKYYYIKLRDRLNRNASPDLFEVTFELEE